MPEKSFDGGLFSRGYESCVLGIDPSLTGFAVTALGLSTGAYMTWVYRSDMRGVHRLIDISNWLTDRVDHLNRTNHDVADVAIEAGVVRSQSAFVLGELHGITRVTLNGLDVGDGRYPLQVAPMSLKKFIAGKGTGVQKNQILLKVYQKWGVEYTDDNAADSYGLAQIAWAVQSSSEPGLAYEREVLSRLNDPKFRDTEYDCAP